VLNKNNCNTKKIKIKTKTQIINNSYVKEIKLNA
jgi:hypothetical protein